MLTNRNCKNIQYGPDFAKTFLGQQGFSDSGDRGGEGGGGTTKYKRRCTSGTRKLVGSDFHQRVQRENVISNQYLNSKKRGWESKQLKMR